MPTIHTLWSSIPIESDLLQFISNNVISEHICIEIELSLYEYVHYIVYKYYLKEVSDLNEKN